MLRPPSTATAATGLRLPSGKLVGAQSNNVRRFPRRLTAPALGLVCALAWLASTANAQDTVRRSFAKPGEAKPIQLFADNIATWTEGGRRAFLLRGQVWIEQGTTSIRMPQGVVWVDEAARKATGVYNLAVYGEGDVALEDGPQRQDVSQALIELATRGEVRIKTYRGEVEQQDLSKDAFVERGRQAQTTPAPAPQKGPDTFSFSAPKPLPPNLPALPLETPPRAPVAAIPAPSGLQQVQAVVPVPPANAQENTLPGFLAVPGVPGPTPAVPPPPSSTNPNARLERGPSRRLSIRPRTSLGISATSYAQNGETAYVVPTGVIVSIGDPGDGKEFLDIEADRMVLWTRGNPQQIFTNLQTSKGETTDSLEFYLSGNVEIRTITGAQSEILRRGMLLRRGPQCCHRPAQQTGGA